MALPASLHKLKDARGEFVLASDRMKKRYGVRLANRIEDGNVAAFSIAKLQKYGERGSPIEGSWLLRGYCQFCGEPMRVEALGGEREICCGKSLPHPNAATTDPDDPWGQNAIRELEDCRDF